MPSKARVARLFLPATSSRSALVAQRPRPRSWVAISVSRRASGRGKGFLASCMTVLSLADRLRHARPVANLPAARNLARANLTVPPQVLGVGVRRLQGGEP